MCTTCGCSETQDVRYTMPGAHTHGADGHSHDHAHPHDHSHIHPHDHGHDHDHRHAPAADPRAALHAGVHGRTIALEQDILAKNQVLAERNRGWFEGREVLAVNLMSSPGSGNNILMECFIL
jgi:hydrogenase nickel incorporation protein HypB